MAHPSPPPSPPGTDDGRTPVGCRVDVEASNRPVYNILNSILCKLTSIFVFKICKSLLKSRGEKVGPDLLVTPLTCYDYWQKKLACPVGG